MANQANFPFAWPKILPSDVNLSGSDGSPVDAICISAVDPKLTGYPRIVNRLISWHCANSTFTVNDLQKDSFAEGRFACENLFPLQSGELIVGVYVYDRNSYVLGMQFLTNTRCSQLYGHRNGDLRFFQTRGSTGSANALAGIKYTVAKPFSEKFAEACLPKDIEFNWVKTYLPRMRSLVVGDQQGLYHDSGLQPVYPLLWTDSSKQDDPSFCTVENFDDPTAAKLSKVVVYYDEHSVRGIGCTYANGVEVKVGSLDGNSGSFTIPDKEYIKSVDVFKGDLIDSLTFFTNLGKRSDKFGGSGGGYMSWDGNAVQSKDSTPVPKMGLVGFSGEAVGERIWRLGPIWSSVPPVSYRVEITTKMPTVAQMKSAPMKMEGFSINEKNITNEVQVTSRTYTETLIESTRSTLSTESVATLEKGLEIGWKGGVNIEVFNAGTEYKGTVKKTDQKIDKTETSHEITSTHICEWKADFRIPRLSKFVGQGSVNRLTLENVPWEGNLIATYEDGSFTTTHVNGAWDIVSYSEISIDLEQLNLDGSKPQFPTTT